MKKIKYILPLFLAIAVFASVLSFAGTLPKISYDYGAADSSVAAVENPNPNSYNPSAVYTLLDPVCPGYTFKGWFFDREYTLPAEKISGDSGDITLYAKWYETVYSVNYILTGGELSDSAGVINPNPSSRPGSESVYLENPSCADTNYIFDGWYFDSAFVSKAESVPAYTYGDVTLYAKWIGREYKIAYDLGEAAEDFETENANPGSYSFGQEILLSSPSANTSLLTFDGWYLDKDFKIKTESIPNGTEGDITLYAKWIRASRKINYILADSSGITEEAVTNKNPHIQDGKADIELIPPETSDKAYSFAGWYSSPDFNESSKITVIEKNTVSDVTVYAKWETAVYSITYDFGVINTNYLPIENPNKTSYKFGEETAFAPVEAEGFIFNGWSLDGSYKSHVTSLPKNSYGDITVYADFTEKTYSIKYVLASGGVTEAQVTNSQNPTVRTTTENAVLKAPVTLNAAYTFDGWYYDSDFTQKVSIIPVYTTENVTVYAKWVKIIVYVPVWGDVSLSSKLNAVDARLALRYAADLENFTDLQKAVGDVNNDGKVNAVDARLILRLTAGLETEESLKAAYNLGEITVKDGEIVIVPREKT